MSLDFSSDDLVFSINKNKEIQFGGYNIKNKLLKTGVPLFKNYFSNDKTLTIPAGLYMLNRAGLTTETLGDNINDDIFNDVYYKNEKNELLVEDGLFNKLEELVSNKSNKNNKTKRRRKGKHKVTQRKK